MQSPGPAPRSPRKFDFEALSAGQPQDFSGPNGLFGNAGRPTPLPSHHKGHSRRKNVKAPTRLLLQGIVLLVVATVAFYAGAGNHGPLDLPRTGQSQAASNYDAVRSWRVSPPGEVGHKVVRVLHSDQSKGGDALGGSTAGGVNNELGGYAAFTAVEALLRMETNTIVIYAFSDTDPEYLENLEFFIRHGVWEGDGCEYIFVIQKSGQPVQPQLPELPANARYMHHANVCYDWGTFGWVLDRVGSEVDKYKYVIFMNSSVRGPFLPATWPKGRHWSRAFTERITDEVKLVGPTISCEGIPKDTSRDAPFRRNPHTQSYLLTTDQAGLAVMKGDGRIFKCHSGLLDAVWDAELGSSKAILTAGYNLDCLMLRYQGVDWRDRVNWQCNGGENPYLEFQNDGVSIHPLEVMFVKIKARQLDIGWTSQLNALKLQKWVDDAAQLGRPSTVGVGAFGIPAETTDLKFPRNLAMTKHAGNGSCFDVKYYLKSNQDLPAVLGETQGAALDHFVHHGQWEGRPFRFNCGHMHDKALLRESNIMPVQQAADIAAAKAASLFEVTTN